MHLRSKLTSEICSKIGGLDRKTEQNRLKMAPLPPFTKIQKQKTVFLEKRKKLVDLLK